MAIPSFQLLRPSETSMSSLFSFLHTPHPPCEESEVPVFPELSAHHHHSVSLGQVTLLLLLNNISIAFYLICLNPYPRPSILNPAVKVILLQCVRKCRFSTSNLLVAAKPLRVKSSLDVGHPYFLFLWCHLLWHPGLEVVPSTLRHIPASGLLDSLCVLHWKLSAQMSCSLTSVRTLLNCHLLQGLSSITLFKRAPRHIPYVPSRLNFSP